MFSSNDDYKNNIKNFKIKKSQLNKNELEYNKIFFKFLNIKKVNFNHQSSKEEDKILGGISPIKFFNNRRKKNIKKRIQSPIPFLINKFKGNNNNNSNNNNNEDNNDNNYYYNFNKNLFNLYYYYNNNLSNYIIPKYNSNIINNNSLKESNIENNNKLPLIKINENDKNKFNSSQQLNNFDNINNVICEKNYMNSIDVENNRYDYTKRINKNLIKSSQNNDISSVIININSPFDTYINPNNIKKEKKTNFLINKEIKIIKKQNNIINENINISLKKIKDSNEIENNNNIINNENKQNFNNNNNNEYKKNCINESNIYEDNYLNKENQDKISYKNSQNKNNNTINNNENENILDKNNNTIEINNVINQNDNKINNININNIQINKNISRNSNNYINKNNCINNNEISINKEINNNNNNNEINSSKKITSKFNSLKQIPPIIKIQRNSAKNIPIKQNNSLVKNSSNKKLRKKSPFPFINKFPIPFNSHSNILKNLNYVQIKFPIFINNPSNVYYFTINKMYRNQLTEFFNHRINWEFIQNKNDPNYKNINFYWKYFSNRVNFKSFKYEKNYPIKKLKMINLFEHNFELGNKKNLFINLINYCNKIKLNVFEIIPLTIIINNTKNIDNYINAFYEIFNNVNNKILSIDKDIIFNKLYSDYFYFDKNFNELKNIYIFIPKQFLSHKNYWILKPTNLYQGKCIEISNNYNEIIKKCKNTFRGVDKRLLINNINNNSSTNNNNKDSISESESESNYNSSNESSSSDEEEEINTISTNKRANTKKHISRMYCSNEIIIQKYLDNPLLYNKRKFDIRCYVLVDSNFNVFYCREGHLKGSSEEYDLNNTNKFIHITNHSVQKKSDKFEKFEFGNEMSYNDFKIVLTQENYSLEIFDKIIEKIKFLIKISMNAVNKKLIKHENVLCFEIFGYDFILDNDFNPYILEINNNPGLGISSPVIEKLVPRMIDDALRITIDKVFKTEYSSECYNKKNKIYKSKYKLDGFTDDENVFEFLCNIS